MENPVFTKQPNADPRPFAFTEFTTQCNQQGFNFSPFYIRANRLVENQGYGFPMLAFHANMVLQFSTMSRGSFRVSRMTIFSEDELLPISALQHLHFCPRQCALIHVEQMWVENRFTAEGRILHERPDKGKSERRGKMKIERDLALHSFRLGLVGKADVVEFHLCDEKIWRPFPVEYKRGRPKKDNCDRVQLCAQAICLEEMVTVEIGQGALFYGKTRRRQDVVFDSKLRQETEHLASELHLLIRREQTPKAVYSKKCEHCSFLHQCLPKQLDHHTSVKDYLMRMIEEK